MALLELKHISQSFPHAKGVLPVIEDLSFTVEEGEFIAIVGPSGCGKSTMLRIVNGLMPPTSGQVLYKGRQVDGINLECALVFQSFALMPWLSVKANVELGLEARGLAPGRPREARQRLYRQGRTRRLRGSLSARTLGRDEAARRPRARARGRAATAADGRAVFGPRRPDRDHPARGIARHLARQVDAGP